MTSGAIAWRPWSAEAFRRAAAEGRPVLLSIVARWCAGSRWMDRTSFADPAVADLVHARFIPVRVDADRRPDVAARYELGGLPTTAILSPDGRLLGGGTAADPGRLAAVLRRAVDACAARDPRMAAHVAPAADDETPPSSRSADAAGLLDAILRTYDPRHGGFGGTPKFPHTAPVRLALRLAADCPSGPWHDAAVTTLDAMGWGPLYDERDGGFFRCAYDDDWGRPGPGKLLPVNAALLALYVEAADRLGAARYADRAGDLLEYLQAVLADTPHGGWFASQRSATAAAVEDADVDRTLYADWNGAMICAALRAGDVLQAPAVSEFAIRSLERILLASYAPGRGVSHCAAADPGLPASAGGEPEVRGLLDDHLWLGLALLDAFEATGREPYRMMAEELALHACHTMWDEEAGGFFDRAASADDVGLLQLPTKPFVSNCLGATLLARLSRASGRTDLAARAAAALSAAAGQAVAAGPLAAEYVLAARDLAGR